jgi:hypothetical protein
MKREYKLIASITGAVIVCAVLMYLRRKESYTNSFSNGNSGPIVELNAIREHGTGHMDGRRDVY